MSTAPSPATPAYEIITITPKALPLYCPSPNGPLWNMHPRVFLEMAPSQITRCPYCGAQYLLKSSETDPLSDTPLSC